MPLLTNVWPSVSRTNFRKDKRSQLSLSRSVSSKIANLSSNVKVLSKAWSRTAPVKMKLNAKRLRKLPLGRRWRSAGLISRSHLALSTC